jgi:hypothetical protein
MDAKNNESAERDFAYFDEMFDFEVYFKDSENEDQNYFSSSGTESESAGTQMSEQNPRHTETLLPASITEQNDLLSRNTPPLPEYSENDIPIWNDHELAWTTPIPWTPVQVMLMEPRETQCQYSDEVLGLNVFQRSTATQGANNHVHKAYSALSLESQSRETTERFVLPTHRDLEWNGQDNQNKPHKNPQGPNLAITDLFGTYPTESVDPPNSWPAVPINEFYISENNVDASISKTENHNEFGPSSTTSNVYQNSFTWNKEDSFSSTGASEDTISPCFENRYFSHLQTAIPAERQESLIPRSHLLDEAAAKPVCHRAFPSKMRSADIQATDVPGMNYGIRTHMTCRQVDSKFSVTFNPPGFQVSENTNVKHSGLHQRVLAPAVQLQAISFPVGRHHPVGIIISQPTYQDHVLTFESKSGASKKLSTRSCYDTEQRLRVAETRKKGACVTCQARKVAVSQMCFQL